MPDERPEQKMTWNELLERTVELGLGAAILTAESAQKVVNDLVNRGQVAREDSNDLVERLLKTGREQRESLLQMIEQTTERTLKQMDLARRSDLDAVRLRLDALERRMMGNLDLHAEPTPPAHSEDVE